MKKPILKFENGIYHFLDIPKEDLTTLNGKFSIQYLTDWDWKYLVGGGNGTQVENLVMDILINEYRYCNISRMIPGWPWDFELTNDGSYRIDVRRTGKKSVGYGHTSGGSLSRKHWSEKAKKLMNGGYLIAKIKKNKMSLYYASAIYLLDSGFECGNDASLNKLEQRFAGFAGITEND